MYTKNTYSINFNNFYNSHLINILMYHEITTKIFTQRKSIIVLSWIIIYDDVIYYSDKSIQLTIILLILTIRN